MGRSNQVSANSSKLIVDEALQVTLPPALCSNFEQRVDTMEEKRRLSIEISLEEQKRFQRLIPWSLGGRIMRILIKQTLDMVEKHGDIVLGCLLTGQITALELLKKGGSDGLIGDTPPSERDDG